MHTILSLTVSESKRLIAKGVAQSDLVKKAAERGTLALVPGTTNGYVYEELTGEEIEKTKYVAGRTLPKGYAGQRIENTYPDLVIRRGERLSISHAEAIADMGPGDVLIKGVNAINYEKKQAGVLVGHPTGGNIGTVIGAVVARRICYLHPVGLEKSIHADLAEISEAIAADAEGKGPTLWIVPGPLFTEIEALEVLAGVRTAPVAAGGIGGAEGAVWLAIFGTKEEIDKADRVIETVRGEPGFCDD